MQTIGGYRKPNRVPDMAFGLLRRWLKPRKYAVLKYHGTTNLGDEIQSIAAMRFLPRVDAWIDRERLDEFESPYDHKIILNGWFLHRPEHWPPCDRLKPLFISFHLTRESYHGLNKLMIAPSTTILSPAGIAYLRRYEPIGTRDLDTLKQLQAAGIKAWFSGCLTLTLRLDDPPPRNDSIYAVDLSDEVFSALSQHYRGPIVRESHQDTQLIDQARFKRARTLLRNYASARAVVTTKLHCALPCLALGTPVLFVETAQDAYRFDGLRDFFHRASEQDILSGNIDFSLDSPPDNSRAWHPLRDRLIKSCEDFIGSK
jgi:hypothetical protein